ncbi:hypothetical protein GGR54DRAFT_492996 [Hypoxylon sp. NC1633]|nr:hypothetical protein GGR54DRAFT_492996 [Hypoxylon sp. NC1633]
MSGAEVLGLISGIITIIDASLKIYEAVDDVSGLPQSFHDVAARLPLVHDTLEKASAGLTDENDTSYIALTKILESCSKKAASLKRVLQAVMPPADASRITRYYKAMKTIPNADKVENLMDGILSDLQVMTGNRAVKAITREQMERIIDAAAKRGGRLEGSGAVSLYNYSTGSQYVQSALGDQNVVSGHGTQINMKGSAGSYYFGWKPESPK